jgi:aspartyl-tRNA(Asn)/glutamyl-tRNA(Gln) amidotransferase subunit A
MSFRYENLPLLQEQLRHGSVTCRKVVEHYLQRCADKHHLNAFIEVFDEDALIRADELDARLREGHTPGKLFGMVIAIKDVIVMKGKGATAGSHILEGFTSLYTATCVQRLLDADAIIIGRTNCDEFAMGSSNETSYFGPVLNDADNTKVPGGSSGGSAVAVQAGLCMAALGTDTGGSIRQPASLTGTVGIKPTYGRISRYGMIAYASSFDQCGTFAHNAIDTALLLEVMSGVDQHDATSADVPVPAYSQHLELDRKLRIAWYPQTLASDKIDPEVKSQFHSLLDKLRADGHTVESVDFSVLDYLVPTYYVLTTAEASSNLSRFSGIHFGHRTKEVAEVDEVISKSRSEGFGKEVKRRIMLGSFVLSSGYYDAYYTHAQKVRRMIRRDTLEVLDKFDIIVTPTTPTTAFSIGEKTTDPVEMYLADIYTVQAPIAGIPAISVPLCRHSNGLPFGIQIMGAPFDEQLMLAVTQHFMERY